MAAPMNDRPLAMGLLPSGSVSWTIPVRSAIPKPIATTDIKSHAPVATANFVPPPECSSAYRIWACRHEEELRKVTFPSKLHSGRLAQVQINGCAQEWTYPETHRSVNEPEKGIVIGCVGLGEGLL